MLKRIFLFVAFLLAIGLLPLINIGCSTEAVYIEFLYHEPCSVCPGIEDYYLVYLHNKAVINNVQEIYKDKVVVEWIEFYSDVGSEKCEQYNLTKELKNINTIIVNHEVIFIGGLNYVDETELREVIDFYLSKIYVHDIAILEITLTPNSAFVGDQINISVTVKNQGNYTDFFNVTICINTDIINSFIDVNLEPDQKITLEFCWNIPEMLAGNYTLSAQASLSSNEIDNINNFLFTYLEVKSSSTPPSVNSDIKIINFIPERTDVYIGEKINLTAYIKNNGARTESLKFEVYYNESLIKPEESLVLKPYETQTVCVIWNTSTVSEGTYLLKAIVKCGSDEDTSIDEYTSIVNVKVPPSSQSTDSDIPSTFIGIAIWAFSLGFFETFSPCLIIMLSFVLGYTLGGDIQFENGFVKVMIFGLGFVFASAVLGITCGLLFLSAPALHMSIVLSVCVFAILFGLHLLGLLDFSVQTKPFLNKVTKKYALKNIGLFLLGFIFYFLDPCIAPIFVSITSILFRDMLFIALLMFSVGALIPFFGIGIFASSISKLSRKVYKNRQIIRGLSGTVLICYAFYLIIALMVKIS